MVVNNFGGFFNEWWMKVLDLRGLQLARRLPWLIRESMRGAK